MELTVENLVPLIEQLPFPDRLKLRAWLDQTTPEPSVVTAEPRDRGVPSEPMLDRALEWEWIKRHKDEYAGQWVALDGNRLIAASPLRASLSAALKADRATEPLIHRMPSPDDLPYIGI